MKKFLYTIVALAGAAMLFSCSKESENPYEQDASLTVKAIDSQFEYGPEATSGVVLIDTEESLTATSDKSWCAASVSGATVSLTLEANTGKITRYAQVLVKSATSSVNLSIVQHGEILGGLSSLSDVTAAVEGEVVRIPVNLNVSVQFLNDADWIHPEVIEDELVITIDRNPDPATRFATVGYKAGSYEGDFEVVQYPELKRNSDWSLRLDDTSFKYPDFTAHTTVTAGASDMYVLYVVPKSTVGSDIEDYVFSTLAVEARRDILGLVERDGGEFADYLNKGTKSVDSGVEAIGDNYIIAIGFADNGYVSGYYQWEAVKIDDVRPDYYKWTGKWNLSGKYFDNTDYSETITIEVDESDVNSDGSLKEARLIMRGFCSKAASAAGAPESINKFYLRFNASTGAVTFYGQNTTESFTHSTQGAGTVLQLMSMYVKAGATSYTNVTGGNILSATMDGTTGAKVEILERSAGLPWLVLRIRYVNAAGSAYTNTNTNNASLILKDFAMVRAD